MNRLLICALFSLSSQALTAGSITQKDTAYRSICEKAASDPQYFKNFRSLEEYAHVAELQDGTPFANYLLQQGSASTLAQLKNFKKLENIGSPSLTYYPFIGNFSGTTLRYITIADDILKRFSLPENPKIAQVGAGFGGQCYILSQLVPFSQYYICDLPENNALTYKVLDSLKVPNARFMPTYLNLPEESVDLFISNYAFSECDKKLQMGYIERIIKKADRGYLLYNHTSHYYGIESISHLDFVAALEQHGIKAEVYPEPVPTFPGNVLVVWDKTKQQ